MYQIILGSQCTRCPANCKQMTGLHLLNTYNLCHVQQFQYHSEKVMSFVSSRQIRNMITAHVSQITKTIDQCKKTLHIVKCLED